MLALQSQCSEVWIGEKNFQSDLEAPLILLVALFCFKEGFVK